MVSCFYLVNGNPLTKSIVTCSRFHSDSSICWRSPVGHRYTAMICRQIKHQETCSATSLCIQSHWYCLCKSRYILVLPEWNVILEWWNPHNTFSLQVFGIKILSCIVESQKNLVYTTQCSTFLWSQSRSVPSLFALLCGLHLCKQDKLSYYAALFGLIHKPLSNNLGRQRACLFLLSASAIMIPL